MREGRYLYAVSILKNTNAEKEALGYLGIRIMKPEPQGSHLTSILMNEVMHVRLYWKYPKRNKCQWENI